MINIFNNSLLFLSGIFIPIESLPIWLQNIAHISLVTKTIEIIKNGSPSSNEFSLFIDSLFYLLFGLIVFSYCEKKTKLHY